MSDFTTEIRHRVTEARRNLAAAEAGGDDYQVRLQLGELESLTRLASEHGVLVDVAEGSLEGAG